AGHPPGGERPRAPSAPAADLLADLRKHEQEHEAQQERLHQRAHDELAEVLSEYDEVAEDQGLQRHLARRERRPSRRRDDLRMIGGELRRRHQSRSSLPVRLMKTVSRLGSLTERSRTSQPASSTALTTR